MGRDDQPRWPDGSSDEVAFGRWPDPGSRRHVGPADPMADRSWTVEAAGGTLTDTLGGPDPTRPDDSLGPEPDVLFTLMAPFDDVFAHPGVFAGQPELRRRSELDEFADWAEDATRALMRDTEKALADGERHVVSSLARPRPIEADYQPMTTADISWAGDYADPRLANPDDVDTTRRSRPAANDPLGSSSSPPAPPAAEYGPRPSETLGPQPYAPSAGSRPARRAGNGSGRPASGRSDDRARPRPVEQRAQPPGQRDRRAQPPGSRDRRPVAGPAPRPAPPRPGTPHPGVDDQHAARQREQEDAFRDYMARRRAGADPITAARGRPPAMRTPPSAPASRVPSRPVGAPRAGGTPREPGRTAPDNPSRREAERTAAHANHQQAQSKRGLGIGLFIAFIIILNIVRSCSENHDRGSAPTPPASVLQVAPGGAGPP